MYKRQLKDKLEKISGKTVTLTQKTDPTVLAGLKVELELSLIHI